MFFNYIEAVVVKHWGPLLWLGFFGSAPWWFRAMLSARLQAKVDEILNAEALRTLAFLCLAISFVWANYLAWAEQHHDVTERDATISNLQKQISTKYQLVGDFDFVAIGDASNATGQDKHGRSVKMFPQGGTIFTIAAEIRNLGEPTTVERYKLMATTGDEQVFNASPQKLPEGKIELGDASQNFQYSGTQALYDLTAKPIDKGSKVRGLLMFYIPNVNREQFRNNARLTLIFEDINETPYRAERMTGQQKEGGGPLYFPGLKMKVEPLPEKKPKKKT